MKRMWMSSVLMLSSLVFAQKPCKPLLPVDLPPNVQCVANIIGANRPGEMSPPKAIERAREVLWDQFKRGEPGFLNLEVATKEGAPTRIVYIVEQSSDNRSIALRWVLQRYLIDIYRHKSKWEPAEQFRATTVIRDEATGQLTFKNGTDIVGQL